MKFLGELFLQLFLIGYVICSPFLFLWFHKNILHEKWDNDLSDKVTVSVYLSSNILAGFISYLIQECARCG